MDFLDQALIRVRSGDGGAGCVSFRREKNVPFGGPDGGDGGTGGDVRVRAVAGISTLSGFRRRRRFAAGNGKRGASRSRSGEKGEDSLIEVPAGTTLFDAEAETVIADLARPGDEVCVGRGGRGGLGNVRFKTSTNRAPRRSTPGTKGVEYPIRMQLRLLADVGLVGLPNAGKSTFLAAVTRARPKIAAYPFTTLHPFLGVVEDVEHPFVLADIPGLIRDAHVGAGLGDRFLGHVERSGALLHLVDCQSEDVEQDWRTVLGELQAYGHGVDRKQRFLCLSKADAVPAEELQEKLLCLRRAGAGEVQALSSATGRGVQALLRLLAGEVRRLREGRT